MSELVVRFNEEEDSAIELFHRSTPSVQGGRLVYMNPHDWNVMLITTAREPRDLVKVVGDTWNAKLVIASAGRFFEVSSDPEQDVGLWRFS